MMYPRIDMEEVETEIEKGWAKARYCLMSKNENDDAHENIDENANTEEPIEEPKIFDMERGTINLSLMKVTDIPTVRRLLPPKPAKIDQETYLLNTKRLLMNTTKEYIEKNCNKKGEVKMKNISKIEEEGL